MTAKQRIKHITKWIKNYAKTAKVSTLVVGISGGIDSSVVSALCAETGLKTIVVQMPIRQNKKLDNRSSMQLRPPLQEAVELWWGARGGRHEPRVSAGGGSARGSGGGRPFAGCTASPSPAA